MDLLVSLPPKKKILNFSWRQFLDTTPKNNGKIVEIGKLKNTKTCSKIKAECYYFLLNAWLCTYISVKISSIADIDF